MGKRPNEAVLMGLCVMKLISCGCVVPLFMAALCSSSDLSFAPRYVSPNVGEVSVGLVMAYYTNQNLASDIDQAYLTGLYKTQPEAWFSWSSWGKMQLNVTIFWHSLNTTEKDQDGVCRDHPGLAFSSVPGYSAADFDVRYFHRLTSVGCAGSCATLNGEVECTAQYPAIISAACDTTSVSDLCENTYLHELLHAVGAGYHQNGYKCTNATLFDAENSWRDCTNEEYGGVFDVLGSGTRSQKVSWGVAAKTRYDLGWMNAEDFEVITKADAPSAWTDSQVDVHLLPLDDDGSTTGARAAVIRFSDATLEGLGTLWVEYRAGLGFDRNITTNFGGYNRGILVFHEGTGLVDLAYDPTDGNDWFRVSLNSGAPAWHDPASGLSLQTLTTDGASGASFRVLFTQPPPCVREHPSMNLPGYFDGYRVWLAQGNLSLYKAPTDSAGWSDMSIDDSYLDYLPYYGTEEIRSYQAIFQYMTSARNNDAPTCGASTMSVRGLALPDGWRVDEGGCMNSVGGQDTTDVCFAVAVPHATPHGAYEILIEIFKEEDQLVSLDLYPLWVCVGGFNPWFQSIFNSRVPPWVCVYGTLTQGVEPTPVIRPDRGDPPTCIVCDHDEDGDEGEPAGEDDDAGEGLGNNGSEGGTGMGGQGREPCFNSSAGNTTARGCAEAPIDAQEEEEEEEDGVVVELTLSLPYSADEFEAVRSNFTAVIAVAAQVDTDDVALTVREVARRRRLLGTVEVEVAISLPDQVSASALISSDALSVSSLNAKLAAAGMQNATMVSAAALRQPPPTISLARTSAASLSLARVVLLWSARLSLRFSA